MVSLLLPKPTKDLKLKVRGEKNNINVCYEYYFILLQRQPGNYVISIFYNIHPFLIDMHDGLFFFFKWQLMLKIFHTVTFILLMVINTLHGLQQCLFFSCCYLTKNFCFSVFFFQEISQIFFTDVPWNAYHIIYSLLISFFKPLQPCQGVFVTKGSI